MMRRTWIAPALLVILGLLAYANSFRGVLVYDDQETIGSNPHTHALWPLTRAMSAPTDTALAGRPLSSLTFALNYALAPADVKDAFITTPGGPTAGSDAVLRNLWGYHAVNLAIHLLASLVLFGTVRRVLLSPRLRDRFGSRATGLAFIAAALWLVHPLQTASVTYLAQRPEALAGLFYLLTIYCAVRAWEARQPWRWTVAAVVACALGMASKEIVVTAPIAVFLLDLLVLAPPPRLTFVGKRWPLYAGLAPTWAIAIALLAANPRPNSAGLLGGWSSWNYLLTQAAVVVHYLRLAVVPDGLTLDYGWPRAQSIASVAPQMAMLAALGALTVWAAVRRHPAAFCGAWFFLVLAPTSSILPIVTEVAADHRMYLPLAGVIALAVVGVGDLVSRASRPKGRNLPTRIGVGIAVALVLTLAVLTHARNEDYANVERIWADAVGKRPDSAAAEHNYGVALLAAERFAEAAPHLRRAVTLDGSWAEYHANLGVALCAQHKFEEGTRQLQEAIRLSPAYADAHRNLAEAYAAQGRFADALRHYRLLLDHRPDDLDVLNKAGWILATSGDAAVRNGQEALALAERAARLTGGGDATSLDTLAAAQAEIGRYGEARATAGRALDVARSKGDGDLGREIEDHLQAYRAGQPFREGR